MARRRRAEKRELTPDVRYNDVLVTQFINYMMSRGKRTLSERLFYNALDLIQERTGPPENPGSLSASCLSQHLYIPVHQCAKSVSRKRLTTPSRNYYAVSGI